MRNLKDSRILISTVVDKMMIGQKTIVLNGIPTSVGEWNRKQDLRGLRG